MFFTADVRYYNEVTEKDDLHHLFVCAESLVEATEQITGWYGEKCIESINITIFSPYDMLIFESNEDEMLYFNVKDSLGERVIW